LNRSNFKSFSAERLRLKQLETTPMKIKQNQMYLLVEGSGQSVALGIDGKLMFFNKDTECMLNSNFKKPIGVSISDWNSVYHINSKREEID
jgi:hypothetical protein